MSWRTTSRDADNPLDDEWGTGRGHCTACGADWNGHAICHCTRCHLTFTSIGPFDAHHVGGRCLTVAELRSKGLQPNDEGHWRKPAPADLSTRFTKGRTS